MPRALRSCILAEIIGTFLLVFFGCGAVHSAVLTGGLVGLWQVGVVWGLAIMLAIFTVGAISGAHLNPAITIGLASWNLFPRQRVLAYIAAQFAGAILAAAVLYVLFSGFLHNLEFTKRVARGEPGSIVTAMCYAEYFPNPGSLAAGKGKFDEKAFEQLNQLVSPGTACLAELLGTLILALVISAVTDEKNPVGPQRLAPAFIGLTVTALICVLAPLTQAGFNPARDFGPRLFAFWADWGTVAIPGPRGWSFLAVYGISPVVGAILGIGLFHKLLRPVIATVENDVR